MKKQESYNFNSLGLIQFAFLKWKPLVIFPVAAGIIAALVSLTITDLYKSSVIMFPAAQTSVSQMLLSSSMVAEEGIGSIGAEDQAEHLLQILNSESIRSKIIEKYNLMEHYDIDPNSKFPYTRLYKKFKKNIKARRTEFLSVEVSVMDKDPQMAADMANDISSLVDTIMNNSLKDRAVKAFKLVEQEYFNLKEQITGMEDSLHTLRELGVIDYEKQAQAYSEGFAQAIAQGNYKSAEIMKKEMKHLADNGGGYSFLMFLIEEESQQFSQLKAKYAQAKVEAEQRLPHKFVIDSAYKAERKAYPRRTYIVFFTCLTAFIFTFIVLLVIENLKSLSPSVETKKN